MRVMGQRQFWPWIGRTLAIKQWLPAHPRFHLHFTPLNLVERCFAELTEKELKRGVHFQALKRDIRAWLAG